MSDLISWLLCSAPQSLPQPVASAHSSSAESESTSDSDSSSDSESESSSSDSDDNEPLETRAPEVLCLPWEGCPVQGRQHSVFGASVSAVGQDPQHPDLSLTMQQDSLPLCWAEAHVSTYQILGLGRGGSGEVTPPFEMIDSTPFGRAAS